MNRNVGLIIILFLVVVGAFFLFRQNLQDSNLVGSEGIGGVRPTVSDQVTETPNAVVREFNVEGVPFSFSVKEVRDGVESAVNADNPSEIRVKKGDRVKINFINKEGFHDFVLDEFNAKTDRLQAGGRQTVEFVANMSGEFEYYCSVPTHREKGMSGQFIVK